MTKTAQLKCSPSASSGRYVIDPRRDAASSTKGMRETAQRIANSVVKEMNQSRKK